MPSQPLDADQRAYRANMRDALLHAANMRAEARRARSPSRVADLLKWANRLEASAIGWASRT